MRFNRDRLALEVQRARGPFLLYILLVALGIVAMWYLTRNLVIQWPWQDTKTARIVVDDAKGIVPGQQDVRIAGVKVGLIEDVETDGKGAVVTLSLEDKAGPIYKNARMRIRPVTPLQDMYVAIENRGTPEAGELDEETVLPAGRTETPTDVSRVLNVMDADSRQRVQALLSGLSEGLPDGGERLRSAFAAVGPFVEQATELTDAMGRRRSQLARLVHNGSRLAAAINTRDRQLAQLMQAGNATMAELAQHNANLGSTLAQLPDTLAVMRSSFARLRKSEDQIDPALRALIPVADNLEDGLEGLRRVSGDAMPALAAVRTPVKQLRPLAGDLETTSDRLDTALGELAPQVPRLDRATKKVLPCRFATAKFFQWTPSVLKYYDSAGAYPRGEMVYGTDVVPGPGNTDPALFRPWTCTQKEGRP
ncbi:MAG: MlaD family protein [Solirubrobacteraceae bacterium]